MKSPSTPERNHRHRTFWRLLWAAVFLLHAPITIKVFAMAMAGAEGHVGSASLLLLAASNLFFVFEIVFAASLRLVTDRRSAVAFMLVVAILHVGVIDSGFPGLVRDGDFHVWLGLSGASFVVLSGRLRTLLHQFVVRAFDAAALVALIRPCYAARSIERAPSLRPQSRWRASPLRAPPRL